MNNALSRREQNKLDSESRILVAALDVFAEKGYGDATMDAIAARAGLSKPTLYQYFENKSALFKTMMLIPRDTMMMALQHDDSVDHITQLWTFALAYAETVLRPDYLSLARLIIGEAQRFPEIGRAYQASGPDKVLDGLQQFMVRQAELGHLTIDDPELAAEDFWGLILSAPRNRALHNPDETLSKKEVLRYVKNGMRVFIRAYATSANRDLQRFSKLTQ